tara:strand:+ start:387 stop:812 length:426 start_codon:yes stop_codon:yes gene_type:complete
MVQGMDYQTFTAQEEQRQSAKKRHAENYRMAIIEAREHDRQQRLNPTKPVIPFTDSDALLVAARKEARAKYQAEYRLEHKAEVDEYQARYRAKNKPKAAVYQTRHRAKVKARLVDYVARNDTITKLEAKIAEQAKIIAALL